jgi:hypothetical protein
VLCPDGFSDATEFDVCRVARNNVGQPKGESQAAEEFILEYLDWRPAKWDALLKAAKTRCIASEGTLNKVRIEMAKAGEIVQVGKGRNAKWTLGDQA